MQKEKRPREDITNLILPGSQGTMEATMAAYQKIPDDIIQRLKDKFIVKGIPLRKIYESYQKIYARQLNGPS